MKSEINWNFHRLVFTHISWFLWNIIHFYRHFIKIVYNICKLLLNYRIIIQKFVKAQSTINMIPVWSALILEEKKTNYAH